ncbi:MAG: phospholipase D-like domain-containing protein [Ignavibacteria bacterium]|nr:phospholipase D-like domain-containing protein [Ignavibacteria bacterium]
MPKIFDNIENQLLDGLKYTLDVAHQADFCVGYFNLRGWKQVAESIDKWTGGQGHQCRLLVGMNRRPEDMVKEIFSTREPEPIDNATAAKLRKSLAQEFKDQLTIGIPTEADERGLRKLSSQIKSKKVIVKLFLRHPLHAKLYLLFRDDKISPIIGYVGSSNLTLAGLKNQGELNVDVLEQDAAQKLTKWFNDRWEDRWCMNISEELAQIIDESWATEQLRMPYHIYLKMAYHLSREARAGISEFKIPREFKEELLEFQQKAVLVAAHHLNSDKRGGVLIGDVVGFGKTITATAVAKIMEEDFFLETLIICPKNLVRMWKDYVHKYRLRADVLSLSKVQNVLPKERRYRVVLIDESHNLRSREGKRYRAIQEYIRLNESKVILLTATPYNKTYADLSNQLRLLIPEDKDLGISPERFIESIGGPVQFMAKYQYPTRSLLAFEKSEFADDWRELMRLFMVRRTRTFIKENYAETDPANGRKYLKFADGHRFYFPDRIPQKVEYPFDSADPNDQYARLYSQKVVDIINDLNLARYGLGRFLEEHPTISPTKDEITIMNNLSRAGKRLMEFCRTNLFKRLESSGHAFLLSIGRHILRNLLYVHALDNKLPLPIGPQESNLLDEFLDDEDLDQGDGTGLKLILDEQQYLSQAKALYDVYNSEHEHRLDWLRAEFFENGLKQSLIADARALLKVLAIAKTWNADKDRKLKALHHILTKQHAKNKILVFTQFADTAVYLYQQLKRLGGNQSECVTGDSEDPTDYAYRFSPMSNEKAGIPGTDAEIRVLISTDVLSEGQNLQDGHIIVNFDLPWALIRLVQRTGRVDRIGQKSEKIICYSFLPEDGLENIIFLRGRLRTRIQQNAEVVGSDETFFEGDPVNIADLYNEKAGILDQEDDGEVDLASYAYQIWKNATDADAELKKIIPNLPNVVYGTKAHSEKKNEGAIVYTRTADDNDILAWVDTKGNIITQSQLTILKASECTPSTPPLHKLENHHKLVEAAMGHIQEVESSIGGQLGKKTGAKYRTYIRLVRYYEENKDTLFAGEPLKRAIDDLYKYPLRESARDTLNRQLKAGLDDTGLAELAVALREEDKLCIVDKTEAERREPQIICSLGMKVQ